MFFFFFKKTAQLLEILEQDSQNRFMFLQNVISVYCMFHFKRIQHYSNTLLKNKTVYKTVAHTEKYKTTQLKLSEGHRTTITQINIFTR